MDRRHRQIAPFMHISYWEKKNQLLFISICTSCRFLPNPRMRGQRLVYQIQNDFLGVLFFRISRISNAAPCGKSHGGTPPQLISYRRSMPPFYVLGGGPILFCFISLVVEKLVKWWFCVLLSRKFLLLLLPVLGNFYVI